MGKKILAGKKGIIFGALNEQSIAWQVALKCREEGAKIVLTNAPLAVRFGEINQLAKEIKAKVIPADVTKVDDLDRLVDESMSYFGGQFDFALHSVAMSYNIRKKHPYTGLNYDGFMETLNISAVSFHKFLQTCFQKDAISPWGSVVALTFIAAHRIFPQYNEMADAKSLLEGIARSFGLHYGNHNKVRINTLSQSPVKTTAGGGIDGFDRFWDYADLMSPLGNAPATALADACTMLFSDYSRYITMQNIYHDGGFSATGLTDAISNTFNDYNNIAGKNVK